VAVSPAGSAGARDDGAVTIIDAAPLPLGYDTAFLGVHVPLPVALGRPQTVDLAYLHFTVILDTIRRLAVVTGVNIDGGELHDLPRTGRWHLDPRVPASAQTGPAVYAANDLDRGHLVRRRDPGWGSKAVARAATEATFAYPNAAPQAAGFNQSKELWLGLEDHVLLYADTNDNRVSVYTAPVLAEGDPRYRGTRIPRRFWKVAAWADGERTLAAAGFVLDQTELLELEEGVLAVPPLGAYRTFQVPIGDIGALAGVDFGPLVEADVFAGDPAITKGEWVELDDADRIRLSPWSDRTVDLP
jgi:endonuclease G